MAEDQFVEIHEPGKAPRRVVLEGVVEIGRECDGELVSDDEVSRRHLKLVPSPTGLRVFDLGSSNGTKVNGVVITTPTVLQPGDVVRLGKTEVIVGSPPPVPVEPPVVQPSSPSRSTTTAAPAPAARSTTTGVTPAAPAAPAAPPAASPDRAPSPSMAMPDVKSKASGVALAVAGRILRSVTRQPKQFLASVVVAGFFFIVLVGALEQIELAALELDAAAVIFPLVILLAVSGISGSSLLAEDMRRGLIDRLVLSSSRRLPVFVGCLMADLVLAAIAALLAIVLGLAYGVSFVTGVGGVVAVLVLAAAWGTAWGAIWYGVALHTANPAHGRRAFGIFVLLLFFSPILVPRDAMTGWLASACLVNPVTYLVEAIRSLQVDGWNSTMLLKAAVAVLVVGAIGVVVGWRALHAQVRRTMGGRSPKAPEVKAVAVSEEQKLREALEAERAARKRAEELLDAQGR